MKYNFWFIVGSQDLYGEEVLKTVAFFAYFNEFGKWYVYKRSWNYVW